MNKRIDETNGLAKPLSRAVIWPLFATLLLAIFLLTQVNRLINASQSVDHSDLVIAEARKARGVIVDLQSNLHSYLLYKDRSSLNIFRQNLKDVPESLSSLTAMVSDNESLLNKIRGIKIAEDRWMTRAQARIMPPATQRFIRHGIMDEIRSRFDSFISEEEKVRALRVTESQLSGQNVLKWGCLLLIALGLFCSLFTTRVLKKMAREHSFLLKDAQLNLERLSQLATELNHAVEVRDDFLSIASHELKTPLTSLKLQVQSVERATRNEKMPSSEQMNRALSIFHQQVTRLTELIENLLDLSKLKQGQIRLEFTKVDFSKLVADVAERIGEQWRYQKPLLTLDIQPNVEIFCDRFRMEQVIVNLLTNAMKYGDRKPVSVQVATTHEMCVLNVIDHGIGIEKAKQSTIFERYERAVSHKHIGGLGLGLFIARQNILAHHGSIEVESQLGKGSVFTMKIPLISNDIRVSEQLTV